MIDTRRQKYINTIRNYCEIELIPDYIAFILLRLGWLKNVTWLECILNWSRVNSASLEQLEILTEIISNAILEKQKRADRRMRNHE